MLIAVYLRLLFDTCMMILYVRYIWLCSILVKLSGDVEENSDPKPC